MNEPFERMQPDQQLPDDVKDSVFNTLDTLRFMGDFVNLFTVNFLESELELLDTITPDNKDD